jgi:hypothetical protein
LIFSVFRQGLQLCSVRDSEGRETELTFANFGWRNVVQGLGPYSTSIKKVEKEIKEMAKKINDLCGESEFFMHFFGFNNENVTQFASELDA